MADNNAAHDHGHAHGAGPAWEQLGAADSGDSPGPRSSHALAYVAPYVYLLAGELTPRVPVDDKGAVWRLNLDDRDASWQRVPTTGDDGACPPPCIAPVAVALGTSILLFGGRTAVDMQQGTLGDVYSLDTTTMAWSKVWSAQQQQQQQQGGDDAAAPAPRSYHAAAALGGRMFVFGGCGPNGRLSDLWAFDPQARSWERMPDPPAGSVAPRGGASLAALPTGRLVLVGGFNGQAEEEEGAAAGGRANAAAEDDAQDDEDAALSPGAPTSSIYVKNLSFATTDAAFRKHFERAAQAAGAKLLSARVARKPAPEPKGAKAKKAAAAAARAGAPPPAALSMGYGFVELDSAAAARAVMRALQGAKLDGHDLRLALSQASASAASSKAAGGAEKAAERAAKKAAAASGAEGAAPPTKLVVRNVAFEATRRDIATLFASFGHARSVRLPQKPDGSHRGFAFVEYATPKEAAAAAAGAAGTHLYGRRLVVEFASSSGGGGGGDNDGDGFAGGGNATGEGLRALAAKTAARSRATVAAGGGKRNKRGGAEEDDADRGEEDDEGDGEAARSVRAAKRLQRTL